MTLCPYCDVCGAIYHPDGERMYQRGFDTKPFFVHSEIVDKPTEDEEVRFQQMIDLFNSSEHHPEWREQILPDIIIYFKKISKLDHTPDCALGAVPACTCGLKEAQDFLINYKKQ